MSDAPALLPVRQRSILRAIRRNGSVQVALLAAELGTSQMTIRRDLAVLARLGEIKRVHGGAVLPRSWRPVATTPARTALSQINSSPRIALAMLVPDASYHYLQVTESAQSTAKQLKVELRTRMADTDVLETRASIAQSVTDGVNGLILALGRRAASSHALMQWIRSLSVPTVFVEHPAESASVLGGLDCISTDHQHGVFQGVEHLMELGHRRIALLAGTGPLDDAVSTGFEVACRVLALPEETPRVRLSRETTQKEIDEFCDKVGETGTTAILAHPDNVAIRLAQNFRERGRAVPEDVAIVAYGDEFAEFADIPLTGIAPPRAALGRTAVLRLMQAISEGQSRTIQHAYLSPILHARSSTR